MKRSKKQRSAEGGFRKGGPPPIRMVTFSRGDGHGPEAVIPLNDQTLQMFARLIDATRWRPTPPVEGTEDEDR